MKWALLILAFGGLLGVTVAADYVSIRQLFVPALQPVHYVGREAYDLSAVRRQSAQRHRVAPSLRSEPERP